MPLDPTAQALLDAVAASGMPPMHELGVDGARNAVKMMPIDPVPDRLARVEDRTIPGPSGDVPVRIYTPEGTGPHPVLVYFHGGGWVICDLDTHDNACRMLASTVPCVVVSVDYRLAPEHPYPAAPDDTYAAVRWVGAHARDIGGDPARLAIGGDSAGGNLTAVTALMVRDRGGPALRAQLLVYPATDATMSAASHRENGEGLFLTQAMMNWFYGHYLGDDRAEARNPYVSPLFAPTLAGLPPAYVITAEYDPLRDEGEQYAARLREAGVATECVRFDGLLHGFFSQVAVFPQARTAVDGASAWLRARFAA